MPSTFTTYAPIVRSPSFKEDGYETESKYSDELITRTKDVSEDLASGETVSSVSYDSSGPTVSGTSNTTTTFTFSVKYTGTVTVSVTTSSSRILIYKYQFIAKDQQSLDYA